jgi:putative salt-induced outer membrane protein YdiY
MKRHILILGFAAIILAANQLEALGQTNSLTQTNQIAPPPPKYPWDSSAAIGLTLTRGNSDTILTTASVGTQKKTPNNEYIFGADASYGKNDGVRSSETLHGIAQYNLLFSERLFGYVHFEGLHDGIADLSYRFTLSPGAGYYFIKETNTTLAGEIGPAIVFERLGTKDDTYETLRLAERFEHKFNSRARVWQSVEFLPQVDRTYNYLANFEVGLEASVTKRLSLRTVLQDNYVNEPAAGRKSNDLKLISGLAYKF